VIDAQDLIGGASCELVEAAMAHLKLGGAVLLLLFLSPLFIEAQYVNMLNDPDDREDCHTRLLFALIDVVRNFSCAS